MTISQSRYGSNAEVGRAPNRKAIKDQHHWGAAAGLGVAGTGLGATRASSVLNNNAGASKAKASQSFAGARISRNDANLQRKLQANEQAKLTKLRGRTPGQAMWITDGKGKRITIPASASPGDIKNIMMKITDDRIRHGHRANMHDAAAQASRAQAGKHYENYARLSRYSKLANRGGKVAIGAGLLGAVGALANTERSRGTVGYKRPTRAQLRGRNVR